VWITDGRGQRSYRRATHWHLARETHRPSWALKIYSTSPSVRGDAHWARPRPQRWRWLEVRHKTANSLATRDRKNERTRLIVSNRYILHLLILSTTASRNMTEHDNMMTVTTSYFKQFLILCRSHCHFYSKSVCE